MRTHAHTSKNLINRKTVRDIPMWTRIAHRDRVPNWTKPIFVCRGARTILSLLSYYYYYVVITVIGARARVNYGVIM